MEDFYKANGMIRIGNQTEIYFVWNKISLFEISWIRKFLDFGKIKFLILGRGMIKIGKLLKLRKSINWKSLIDLREIFFIKLERSKIKNWKLKD